MACLPRFAPELQSASSKHFNRWAVLLGGLACGLPGLLSAQGMPQAAVSSPVEYGYVEYGSSRTLPVPVVNTGAGSLTISPSIHGASYKVVGAEPANCMLGTSAGQTCTLDVEFDPLRVGIHADILTLTTNGPSNPTVKLTGRGTGVGPVLETPLDFGTIPLGSTKVLQLVIEDVESYSSVKLAPSIEGSGFTVVPLPESSSLFSCDSKGIQHFYYGYCLMSIEFSPSTTGYQSAVLTISPTEFSGPGPGFMLSPTEITLEGTLALSSTPTPPISGSIYVADDNRVQIFDGDGVYHGQFTQSSYAGTGSIAVSPSNVFLSSGGVSDCGVGRLDGAGALLQQFAPCLPLDHYNNSRAIAVAANGDLWVANSGGYVQHFDQSGNSLSTFCVSSNFAGPGCPLAVGLIGDITPSGIALDQTGNIYITSSNTDLAVVKFDSTGNFLLSFGPKGTADGQFQYPSGIAVDAAGTIYVADSVNNRIQIFDANGRFLRKIGHYGRSAGGLNYPFGIVLDAAGNIYVANSDNERIEKYANDGTYLARFGTDGSHNGEFYIPYAIAIAP